MSDIPTQDMPPKGTLDSIENFGFRSALYLNPEKSDVSIVGEHGGEKFIFPAHSAVLSDTSDVFRKIIESRLKGSLNVEIVINDASPLIVESVLRYIYRRKIYFQGWTEASQILSLAHRYKIKELIKRCQNFLSESLCLPNILSILQIATLYELSDLKDQCLLICGKAAFSVLKSKSFAMLSKHVVHDILRLSYLNVESEWALFSSLWNWSVLSCCRRGLVPSEQNTLNQFKEFSQYIRFDQVSKSERKKFPQSVLSRFAPENEMDTHSENVSRVGGHLRKNRKLLFYKDLLKYAVVFELKYPNLGTSENFGSKEITAIAFSVDNNACLMEFVLVCIFSDSPQLIKMNFGSPGETTGTSFFFWKGAFPWKHVATLSDGSSVKEATVQTKTPFLLQAGQKYYLDMCCPHGSEIKWPRSDETKDFCQECLTITVLSNPCYGVSHMSLIPMPYV